MQKAYKYEDEYGYEYGYEFEYEFEYKYVQVHVHVLRTSTHTCAMIRANVKYFVQRQLQKKTDKYTSSRQWEFRFGRPGGPRQLLSLVLM